MTLEQLRIFVTVAETLNMRAASETLHLTQPAVSAAVAALETRYNSRLFDRVGRGLELNAAGTAFLPEARAVIRQAEKARHVLDDLAGLLRGEVRIAASQTVATYWLPTRMARFAALHPGIELPLTVGNTAQAAQAVLSGHADLAFVEGTVDEARLDVSVVGGDRLGLYTTPAHPLVGVAIGPGQLRDASWVMREFGSGTRDHFSAALAERGIAIADLSIRLTLPSNGAVLAAVGAGEMIGVVSDLAAAARLITGSITQLNYTLPARKFRLLMHRDRKASRAVGAFVEALSIAG